MDNWKQVAVTWFALGLLFGVVTAFASCSPADPPYHVTTVTQ
jgi:hypothetical protein